MDREFNASSLDLNQFLRTKRHPILLWTVRILVVLVGCFIGAVSLNSFLVPAHILAGGLTGVAQFIHHFISVPIGTLYFLFNIPLFFLGYRYLGKRFILLTGVGIIGFSTFADLVHLNFPLTTKDPLLMSLYGGVLSGISSGIIFRVGGSAGGTDILSLVFHRLTGRSVGSLGFSMNVVVVLLSITIFSVEAGMYTLVAMFAASRVVNALLNYQNRKTALIVSTKADEIAQAIGEQLGRGSTIISAYGSYTHAATQVLMCALTHLELTDLRLLCRRIDPNVFITVVPTTEVFGHFRNLPV